MIIWIASYPKSGNTYIRSFLSAYYYSINGEFNFKLLKYIEQFPDKQFFNGFIHNKDEAAKNWLPMQKKIISSKRVKILKTHSAYGSYNNNPFTTSDVTLGGIYVVRDPRNIITSLMNHFSLKQDEALQMIFDKNRGIKSADNNYATYSFLSSWSNHVKSWSNINNFRTMIIKYEELEDNYEKLLVDLIKFINVLLKNNEGIDYQKFKRALQTTRFDKLKEIENLDGFSEAMISKKSGGKVPFFNLGFKSDWKKDLDNMIAKKIEENLGEEMKNMGYL